jgi:hypothetical protein
VTALASVGSATVKFITTAVIVPMPAETATPFVTLTAIVSPGPTTALGTPMPLRVSRTRVGLTGTYVLPVMVTLAVLVIVCALSVRVTVTVYVPGRAYMWPAVR